MQCVVVTTEEPSPRYLGHRNYVRIVRKARSLGDQLVLKVIYFFTVKDS